MATVLRQARAPRATSRPRDLDSLARTFEILHEVKPDFFPRVAAHLPEELFFKSTSSEWRSQSQELQQVLGFFASGKESQPARKWIEANQNLIQGPLKTRLALIAPEVAIAFHKNGKGVQLVSANEARWNETCLAIAGIARIDQAVCAELVEKQLPQFEAALYRLSLRPLNWISKFFRILHELSPELFDKLVDRLDLDKTEANKTIDQIVRSQPDQRLAYIKLARAGRAYPGKIGQLSQALFNRIRLSS